MTDLRSAALDVLEMYMGPLSDCYPVDNWRGTLTLFFKDQLPGRKHYVFAVNVGEALTGFTTGADGQDVSILAKVWSRRADLVRGTDRLSNQTLRDVEAYAVLHFDQAVYSVPDRDLNIIKKFRLALETLRSLRVAERLIAMLLPDAVGPLFLNNSSTVRQEERTRLLASITQSPEVLMECDWWGHLIVTSLAYQC